MGKKHVSACYARGLFKKLRLTKGLHKTQTTRVRQLLEKCHVKKLISKNDIYNLFHRVRIRKKKQERTYLSTVKGFFSLIKASEEAICKKIRMYSACYYTYSIRLEKQTSYNTKGLHKS